MHSVFHYSEKSNFSPETGLVAWSHAPIIINISWDLMEERGRNGKGLKIIN